MRWLLSPKASCGNPVRFTTLHALVAESYRCVLIADFTSIWNYQVHIFGQGSAPQDIDAAHMYVHILMCLVVFK